MNGRLVILAIVAAALSASCTPRPSHYDYADFRNRTEYGVYVGGDRSVTFIRTQHELGFIRSQREFRIQDGAQNIILHTKLSADPVQNAALSLTLSGSSAPAPGSYSVKVTAISADRVWLWSEERHTGFIIHWE